MKGCISWTRVPSELVYRDWRCMGYDCIVQSREIQRRHEYGVCIIGIMVSHHIGSSLGVVDVARMYDS